MNIKDIAREKGELVVNLALVLLVQKGTEFFSNEENVNELIKGIKDDAAYSKKGAILATETMISVCETAADIAKASPNEIFSYVRRYTASPDNPLDNWDAITKERLAGIVKGIVDYNLEAMTCTDAYDELIATGMSDREIDSLGYGEVLFGEE